eukprot:UN07915
MMFSTFFYKNICCSFTLHFKISINAKSTKLHVILYFVEAKHVVKTAVLYIGWILILLKLKST